MTEQERMNADSAAAKAAALYPRETWREIEERIFIAASREPKSKNQEQVLNKELVQARILKLRGSCIYLLPEVISQESVGEKFPDAVVDGFLMEFKTVTGNLREIERRFKESRKKAERVFFKVDSPLATDAVKRKISQVSKEKQYERGLAVVYFSETCKIYYWNIRDLRDGGV